VPLDFDPAVRRSGRPIGVVLDGGPGDEPLLAYATAEARERGATVRVVEHPAGSSSADVARARRTCQLVVASARWASAAGAGRAVTPGGRCPLVTVATA
jgi:hypothetical protein